MTRILLVDDDPRITGFLRRGLEAEGYRVALAMTGSEALRMGLDEDFPLIVLDLGLPDVDGLEVCRQLRRAGRRGGVLMLTARDKLDNKLQGLRSGADDYLTKPFELEELLARLEALTRRAAPPAPTMADLVVGDLVVEPGLRLVRLAGDEVRLTAREYALLECLMRNAGQVVTRSRLLREVWGLNFDPGTKVVEVYIRYLRAKLDRPGRSSQVRAVRGVGYVLEP